MNEYTFNRMLCNFYYNKMLDNVLLYPMLESVVNNNDNNLEKLDSKFTDKLLKLTNNSGDKKCIKSGMLYGALLIIVGTGMLNFQNVNDLLEIISDPMKMTPAQANIFVGNLCLLAGHIILSMYSGTIKKYVYKFYLEYKDIDNQVKNFK